MASMATPDSGDSNLPKESSNEICDIINCVAIYIDIDRKRQWLEPELYPVFFTREKLFLGKVLILQERFIALEMETVMRLAAVRRRKSTRWTILKPFLL